MAGSEKVEKSERELIWEGGAGGWVILMKGRAHMPGASVVHHRPGGGRSCAASATLRSTPLLFRSFRYEQSHLVSNLNELQIPFRSMQLKINCN